MDLMPYVMAGLHAGHPRRPASPSVIAYGLLLRVSSLDGGDGVLVDGRVKRGHDARSQPQTNKSTANAIRAFCFTQQSWVWRDRPSSGEFPGKRARQGRDLTEQRMAQGSSRHGLRNILRVGCENLPGLAEQGGLDIDTKHRSLQGHRANPDAAPRSISATQPLQNR